MQETKEFINNLSKEIYQANKVKGFWNSRELIPYNMREASASDRELIFSSQDIKAVQKAFNAQMLALIHSEISEALEADRKDLMDDKLPHRKMAEVEMADTAIRVLDVMGAFNWQYTDGTDMSDNWWSFDPHPGLDTKEDRLFALVGLVTREDMYNKARTWMSNILYLIMEYCKRYDYDLWSAVREKLEYNKTRYDHTDEGRAAEGGKKW